MPEGHPDRKKVQGEINDIERWCIASGNGNVKEVTAWDRYYDIAKYRPPKYPDGSGAVFFEDL